MEQGPSQEIKKSSLEPVQVNASIDDANSETVSQCFTIPVEEKKDN